MNLAEKIWNVVEAVVNPRHLLFVVFVVASLLILKQPNLAARFGIEEFVISYRPWIVLALLGSGGLILLGGIHWFLRLISIWNYNRAELAKIRKLKLSSEACIALHYVWTQRPDSVLLLTSNPFIRELRRNNLIYMHVSHPISDQDGYKLSSIGEARAHTSNVEKFYAMAEGDQLDFLKSVTGSNLSYERVQRF
jgi:hypothetical protein